MKPTIIQKANAISWWLNTFTDDGKPESKKIDRTGLDIIKKGDTSLIDLVYRVVICGV